MRLLVSPCISQILRPAANIECRRTVGQYAAQERSRNKDDCLCTLDPARPLHFEPLVQRDTHKGSTGELQKLHPRRCQFYGEHRFAAPTAPQAAAVAEGKYTCDLYKRDKKLVKSFSAANDLDPGAVPTYSRVLLRRERCSSRKAVPLCVCIA